MKLRNETLDELRKFLEKIIETRANVVAFIRRFNLGESSLDLSISKNLAIIYPALAERTEGIIEILEYCIDLYYEKHPNAGEKDFLGNIEIDIHNDFPDFIGNLKIDGFLIRDKKLARTTPKALESAKIQDELDSLLVKFGMDTAKGHLNQAIDNINKANWAAANAQIRSFYESVLIDTTKKLDEKSEVKNGGEAIDFLSNIKFFFKELNEIDDRNTPYGFIKGLWKILHTGGSHPGLSDEGDCLFRYHLILITSNYFLKRLVKFL